MIFQNSMGPRKSRCDVPSGTTQGWAYPFLIGSSQMAIPFSCFSCCNTPPYIVLKFEIENKQYGIKILCM
jgi:hypothetical protein